MKKLKKILDDKYLFGATVLRLAFGIFFVLVAVKKLRMGYFGFADSLIAGDGNLAREISPIILQLYGGIIPGAELLLGAMLLLNFYTRWAWAGIAFIYLTFIFGQMYDGNTVKIGTEYFPSLIALTLAYIFEEKAKE